MFRDLAHPLILVPENEGMTRITGRAVKFNTHGTFMAIVNDEIAVREQDGPEEAARKFIFSSAIAKLPTPFDPLQWNTYELQFRGGLFHVLVNGQELLAHERAVGRDDGSVALGIQSIRVAVRKVEALQR